MGGGPDNPVASSSLKPSGGSRDAPADCFPADLAHGTSVVPVLIETNGASSQSPPPDGNDARSIKSHENTKADDTEDDTATVTVREQMKKKQPETRPITQEQLVAEVKDIYAGLVMVERKCIEVDAYQIPRAGGPLDITRYLLMIPASKLIQLQNSETRPEDTVRTWYFKVHKDATKDSPATSEDSSTTPPTTTDTLPTTSKDCPATSEEASAHPHVSEKTAHQVGSDEDYLHGFQVALENRAKELGWLEYQDIAALTTAEIGEEGRQKVIDEKCFLAIGYKLVDQFLRDFESIKEKAEKKIADEAKAEQEAAQAKKDNKDSNPDPEATPTSVVETPDNPEAQSRPSNGTQQAVSKETSPVEVVTAPQKEAFEEIDPQEVEDASKKAAPEEVATTQQHSAQDTNLSTQEPQASPEDASVPPKDSGKDAADTTVDTSALTKETRSKSERKPKTKLPLYVDFRPLSDKRRYNKVGKEIWVLADGQWVPSLTAEHFAALTALHRTLLHEHYDFLLASQHPSASAALRRLAAKYNMPARMWGHAIHTFLELMRPRLVESQEFMDGFIILAYHMLSLLDETVPRFLDTWTECKGDMARYRMVTQTNDKVTWQRWRDISREEYTRALGENLTTGRLYHHLAIQEEPWTRVSPDEYFDAVVSQLFYYTKSLVVKTPFSNTRGSMLILIERIVARNEEEAEKPASVPQTDKDHFLTAVAHLILASMESKTLRENGHKDSRNDHVQIVYAALKKIKSGGSSKTSRIPPSPQLGLLLCQLLLGIPLADNRRSPMMAAWAPDLVAAEDRADSDAMANARDIHDATIELIRTMVPYLLEEADTRDLRVWEYIYVILVFMRSLKMRPDLLEWLGSAFHAQLLEPYLNMLLREDETRGGLALERASQSEVVTICSSLNERKKSGKYGLSAEDSRRMYCRAQEEQRKAERVKSTATAGEATAGEATADEATYDYRSTWGAAGSTAEVATVTTEEAVVPLKWTQMTAEEAMAAPEDTTTSDDAAHERDWEPKFASPLPEHWLLAGLFFARESEPEPCDKSLEKPTEHTVVVACPSAPEAVQTAEKPTVQTVEEPAVEKQQEASLTDSETESNAHKGFSTDSNTDSETECVILTDSESENAAEYDILDVPKLECQAQEGEQAKRETVEAPPAEVRIKETEADEASVVEVERKQSENEDAQQQVAQTKEVEAEKTQEEDEEKAREAEDARVAEEERERREAKEAEEAEVRRQEGLRRDPPLFPNGWLKKSRYNFDEIRVLNYVQSAEMCNDRSIQILCLAAQLNGHFFVFETDEEGHNRISVPGASSGPKFDLNKKMPEIIERGGGVRVVYVHPSFHTAEIERETERAAWTEKGQKEMERREEERQKEKDKEAKATTNVATAVDKKAEGDAAEVSAANNTSEASQTTDTTKQQPAQSEEPVSHVDAEEAPEAVNVPAGALIVVSDDDNYEPISAYDMALWKAAKLSSIHEAEPTEAEVETTPTPPVQGEYDSQDTKPSDAGPDAAAATAPVEEPATVPQASVQLTEGVLDETPSVEDSTEAIERWRTSSEESRADEDSWVDVGDESHGDSETAPTVQTVQKGSRSMFSRRFYWR